MAGLLSLAQAASGLLNQRTTSASLVPLDSSDNISLTDHGGELTFQYFPETLTIPKRNDYAVKQIPGGSLPIYQWVSGGERVVSFTANFTTDVDLIGASAGGINASDTLKSTGNQSRNIDVRSALIWLNSYMLPSYLQQSASITNIITEAPNKMILTMPNTGIGLMGGTNLFDDDSILCLMLQCDVVIEAIFPSGMLRSASVQLSFAQIPQFQGAVTFPKYDDKMNAAISGGAATSYFGYQIQAPTLPSFKIP